MRVLILVGNRKPQVDDKGKVVDSGGPENLYTGLNGVELASVAADAAKSGEYTFIGKLTNPACTPMALAGGEPKHSTPVFPKPSQHKVVQAPAVKKEVADTALAEQRAARLQTTPLATSEQIAKAEAEKTAAKLLAANPPAPAASASNTPPPPAAADGGDQSKTTETETES